MNDFKLEAFLNPNLMLGADTVTAALTVSGSISTATSTGAKNVFGLVVDCSGSMKEAADSSRRNSKMTAAISAAQACINSIPDGMEFFIVSFQSEARVVFSRSPASESTRRAANNAVLSIVADGGTFMSNALRLCREQAAGNGICVVALLTDGDNHPDDTVYLNQEIAACGGLLTVHCRGLGTDWKRAKLQPVSDGLMGTINLITNPEQMGQDFRQVMEDARSKSLSDLRLRIWSPKSTTIRSVKQMFPTELDITAKMMPVDQRTVDFPLGAWGQESQDYQVVFNTMPRNPDGLSTAISRPTLVYTDPATGQTVEVPAEVHYDPSPEWGTSRPGVMESAWTDNASLTMRVNRMVSHYGDEGEKAIAKQEFAEAWDSGDDAKATIRLQKVMELAERSGDEETKRMVRQVAEVDSSTGTVILRRRTEVSKADVMGIEVASTRTVRARRS